MARRMYALDLGRGFLLVDHRVIVEAVRVRGGLVEVDTAVGGRMMFGMGERVLAEEDTPQRARLLAAVNARMAGEGLR